MSVLWEYVGLAHIRRNLQTFGPRRVQQCVFAFRHVVLYGTHTALTIAAYELRSPLGGFDTVMFVDSRYYDMAP